MVSSVDDNNEKISAQFRLRLEQLDPEEIVRAIAMPVYRPSDDDRTWMTRTERRDAATSAMADALGRLQANMDAFLASTDGSRLTSEYAASSAYRLGYVVFEAAARTVLLLAEQPWISVIIEDQDVGLLDTSN